jgi:hypothetical protein
MQLNGHDLPDDELEKAVRQQQALKELQAVYGAWEKMCTQLVMDEVLPLEGVHTVATLIHATILFACAATKPPHEREEYIMKNTDTYVAKVMSELSKDPRWLSEVDYFRKPPPTTE